MRKQIVNILKKHFETVPFHNFQILLGEDVNRTIGGVCSDKTILLKEELNISGFDCLLHSAMIKGESIHQLIKIVIDGEPYLLDPGLGWPLLSPISLKKNSCFHHYGLTFRAVLCGDYLELSREHNGSYIVNYSTNINDQNQKYILKQIDNKLVNTDKYPFRNSIRYSQVVADEFYFLKGDTLGFSRQGRFHKTRIGSKREFVDLFENIFCINKELPLEAAKKTGMFSL